jgi:hypothetical protein
VLAGAPTLVRRLHFGRIVHANTRGDGVLADDHDAERKAELRIAILRYLREHPLAGDTPEGIAACWVPPHGYEDALLHLGDVVDTMVAAGELAPRALPDDRILYVRGPRLLE